MAIGFYVGLGQFDVDRMIYIRYLHESASPQNILPPFLGNLLGTAFELPPCVFSFELVLDGKVLCVGNDVGD